MLKIIGNDIHLTKGDTAYLTLDIKLNNGKKITYHEGDTITMTVKKRISSTASFKKNVKADEVITILPTDTKDLGTGRYKYDIQFNSSLGEVFTIVPESAFYLEEEVTE